MKHKYIFTFIFYFLVILSKHTMANETKGHGGYGGEFLRFGFGARPLAMSNAFVAIANDANAIYYNPSGLSRLKKYEFTSFYTNLFLENHFFGGSVILPHMFTHGFSLGFGWIYLSSDNYTQTDLYGDIQGSFGYFQNAFFISSSYEQAIDIGTLSYGFTFKFLNQNIHGLSYIEGLNKYDDHRTTCKNEMDMGFIYNPIILPFKFGFCAKNVFQTNLSFGKDENDKIPISLSFGLSGNIFSWKRRKTLEVIYSLQYDTILEGKGNQFINLGTEADFNFDALSAYFRLGINLYGKNLKLEDKFAIGIGLECSFDEIGNIKFDYTYRHHPYLDNNNIYSITGRFGVDVLKSMNEKFENSYTKDKNSYNKDESKEYAIRIVSYMPNKYVEVAADTLASIMKKEDKPCIAKLYRNLTDYINQARNDIKRLSIIGKDHDDYDNLIKSAHSNFSKAWKYKIENLNQTDIVNYFSTKIIGFLRKHKNSDKAIDIDSLLINRLIGIEISSDNKQKARYIYGLHRLNLIQSLKNDTVQKKQLLEELYQEFKNITETDSLKGIGLLKCGIIERLRGNYSAAITLLDSVIHYYPTPPKHGYYYYHEYGDRIDDNARYEKIFCLKDSLDKASLIEYENVICGEIKNKILSELVKMEFDIRNKSSEFLTKGNIKQILKNLYMLYINME